MPRAVRNEGFYYDGDTGAWHPSVTSIVGVVGGGAELSNWYGRLGVDEANRVRDAAARVGSNVHALIRWSLTHKPVDISRLEPSNLIRIGYQAWEIWATRHLLRPILAEQYLLHPGYLYAGTMDFYGWVSTCDNPKCCGVAGIERLEVIDWKTSKSLRKKEQMQVPAYANVLMAHGFPVNGVRLLRIGNVDPDGELLGTQSKDLTDQFDFLFQRFLDAKRLFEWMKTPPRSTPKWLPNRKPIPKFSIKLIGEAKIPEALCLT